MGETIMGTGALLGAPAQGPKLRATLNGDGCGKSPQDREKRGFRGREFSSAVGVNGVDGR
jgi:hypothetical protein